MKKILLTGGLGYIGSHVAIELIQKGFDPVILDDLSNSELFVLDKLQELSAREIKLEKGDIRDFDFLTTLFSTYHIEGIIHLAAKKAVAESVREPLLYYDVNVLGLVNLLKVIKKAGVKRFIFSSSCTVYGHPHRFPVTEQTPFGDTPSPYGKSKQICEQMLQDVSSQVDFKVVSLRYFNPVGAHETAKIGELPKGIPNNLVPYITQTAAGWREELSIFGDDYQTADGTAIRDYIHVVDLARAHVCALEVEVPKYIALNVGTGKGHSVLEVVHTFQDATGIKLPYKIVDRRPGDVPEIYGDTRFANTILGWKADKGLSEMLVDSWNWQQTLPEKAID
ncbi:MAG: UDP-glucose 4-epimerase GalE [Bacteroidota bacterium]